MTTVAVMQPYFMPYAGYYRLFAAADVFVMYDCVQFPRRGWVHRNRFSTASGQLDWLTLPLSKCARDTRIDGLVFAPDASERIAGGLQRFPALEAARRDGSALIDLVTDLGSGCVADYLHSQLARIVSLLGISCSIVRSRDLDIDPDMHGQARVIEIARTVGATRYVNSPGGRALYDAGAFAAHGVELRFLTPFIRSTDSILTMLLNETVESVAAVVRDEATLCH
jgi:hypothetical protein